MSVPPKKAYGQHFLADRNILDVIGRLAELAPEDIVLEIGPGQGVLTRYLAERVTRVHAIEIDRELEVELRDLPPNVDVVFGDALQLELPQDATKLVSNLPYNVATPIVVESLDSMPGVALWCVMVQREVADRFFAAPSTKDYGAVSVLVQLVTERTGFHPVSRTVFRPPPNVDSALVAFRRVGLPDAYARVKRIVTASFAHRRKTLPNSLELAGVASRAAAAGALAAIGRDANVRAEALAPHEFVALVQALRLVELLPGVEIRLTGTASLPDIESHDIDLVVITDDVAHASTRLATAYPPLHRDEWRDDWAAFRTSGSPQVDVVVTKAGTRGYAHHVAAWERIAADPSLRNEYRRLDRRMPERKCEFFERVVASLR
jgi:16S rRNA (adenine1518-N6/adenine1519-N6)-dimethyltransferase